MAPSSDKEFWDIFEKLQRLYHLSNDSAQDPTVNRHLKLMANMIYFYRRDGVKKVKEAVRDKWLRSMGVAVIKPKGKPRG